MLRRKALRIRSLAVVIAATVGTGSIGQPSPRAHSGSQAPASHTRGRGTIESGHGSKRVAGKGKAKSGKSKPAAAKKQPHMLEQIGKVNGTGWYVPWYRRDPAHPDGPPIPVLLAEAESGEIEKRGNSPQILLHGVNAKLYQKGIHSANIRARNVRTDQAANFVFASGGCRVVSILNPADTVLTSDRLTWDIAKTKIVAEGHAHVERRPKNGVPITQDGGTIIYDLEHNTVTVQ